MTRCPPAPGLGLGLGLANNLDAGLGLTAGLVLGLESGEATALIGRVSDALVPGSGEADFDVPCPWLEPQAARKIRDSEQARMQTPVGILVGPPECFILITSA